MIKYFYFVFFVLDIICLSQSSGISGDVPGHSKYCYIRAYFDENFTAKDIYKYDFDYENSIVKEGLFIESTIRVDELKILQSKKIKTEIIIPDLEEYYQSRFTDIKEINDKTLALSNFKLGSMGGFLTLSQVDAAFASMKQIFPNFISNPITIGYSYENRPIKAYLIGNSIANGKQALLTGIHHAREPGGMMTLVYFAWDYLQKIGSKDPEALYLLSNRATYIIPVVNPDGYYYNELTDPMGGGVWRKNRRKFNDTTFGVDLNRNYGPVNFWNATNDGSSMDSSTDVFRGDSAFSEPETRAIRDFCQLHNFKTALNYHTFSNDLIYPWSALDSETPDSNLYRAMAQEFTTVSKLAFGRDNVTVGYPVCGDSDDWMYLDDNKKAKIIAMTPELGNNLDGFWPPTTRILPIAQENLKMNYQLVWSAGVNLRPVTVNYDYINSTGELSVTIQNIGVLSASSSSTLTLTSLSNKIDIFSNNRTIAHLNSDSSQKEIFDINFQQGFIDGMKIPILVQVLQEGVARIDTFNISFFNSYPKLLFQNGVLANNWTMGQWGLENDFILKREVLSDSPGKDYDDKTENYLQYNNPFFINDSNAILEFNARWTIEPGYDYFVVQVSPDSGTTWHYLKSPRMRDGIGAQGNLQKKGMTGLDGNFPFWIKQICSLDSFAGKQVFLRFGILSDAATHYDGIYLDDIKIRLADEVVPKGVNDKFSDNSNILCYPNPVKAGTALNLQISNNLISRNCIIRISNILGQSIFENEYDNVYSIPNISVPTNNFTLGFYFGEIIIGENIQRFKFEVVP